MIRKIRIVLAAVMMVGITLLLLDFTGTAHLWLGWMARVQLLPAALAVNVVVLAVLAVVTLLLGRVYCSVICPLGIMQDLISSLRKKKFRYNYSRPLTWLRWLMVAVLVVAVATGVGSLVALLDPYGNYGRIATNLLQPLWLWGDNALASIAEHYDSYAFYSKDVWLRGGLTLGIAVAMLALVGTLAWRGGRTYCNTLCPVGTVLGLLSRWSWLKVRINTDKCVSCGLCERACKASCIDSKNHTIDYSRCVVCGNCLDTCSHGALNILSPRPLHQEGELKPEATSLREARRAMLVGAAIVMAEAVLAQTGKKVDGGLAMIEDKKAPSRTTPLTPPGSLGADNMRHHCTACQLCVTQCPNDVLRPGGDLMSLMQPVMSYERGYCRPECNRCSEVCPTGAIRPISVEEKVSTVIGHAVWIKENCVVLSDGVACGNCARHCPSEAIMMVQLDPDDELSPMVPAVDRSRCIGCGACEYVCPARPFSAIYVEGHERHSTR